jgi:ABC-type sugar transport system ATPase subunit
MSVFENLAFALRIRKLPDAEIKARVEEVARSLAIEAYLDRRPKALSGGQRQRVAIGRAVVRRPKVFLFDEPLSNLDAKLRGDMRREIARLHRESQTTSLYVTHDQIEAMTLADRIVVLKDGTLQQVGSPLEIYRTPANRFVAGFFGTPAMNFLAPGSLQRELGERVHDGVVLGIRPVDIGLERRGDDRVALTGAVQLREVLGAEVVLHVASAAGEVTVRADARTPSRPGDNVTMWLDPTAMHYFDAQSEHRLAS